MKRTDNVDIETVPKKKVMIKKKKKKNK